MTHLILMNSKILAAFALLALLGGCGKDEGDPAQQNTLSAGLVITHSLAYPREAAAPVGIAYVSIANGGPGEDRLLSAESPVSERVEIHETVDEEGMIKMKHHDKGVLIEEGETLLMEPGGSHLMLMGMKTALVDGEKLKMTLHFKKAGPMEIEIPIGKQPW